MEIVDVRVHYLFPVFAYLLGSIPFGLVLSNVFGNGLLRVTGSKNIGATNVMRTQGKLLGLLTFLLDFSKGLAACYLFQTENNYLALCVIAAPVIGHMFPLWLRLKGGKGIATYFGVLCSLNIYAFLGTIAIWLIVFWRSKVSSISGLFSIVSSCALFSVISMMQNLDFINHAYVLIILVMIIVAKHYENIRRLLDNSELRLR